MSTIIIAILVCAMAITFAHVVPPVSAAWDTATTNAVAAGMHWDQVGSASATRLLLWNRFNDNIPTWVFLTAAPNPVGIGQAFTLVMFNPQVPQGALITNDIRYQYTIDVTKPNGDKETLPPAGKTSGNVAQGGVIGGKFVSDSTGAAYTTYVPDQTGNYTFNVKFEQLYWRWNYTSGFGAQAADWYGCTLLASNYTLPVTVQDEPVSINGLPLIEPMPTEYWSRPVEGQNTMWFQVTSNWLSGPHDRDNGGAENRLQAEGIAPESSHILWTRPTEDNGVVGGANLSRPGNVFNAGSQYQPRWTNQIIMYGRLYYSPNVLTSGSSSLLDCVDLKTGELIYEVETGGANVEGLLGVSTTANMPQFGYYYSQDDPNEHGIQNPGWLFSSNYAIGYQPQRGFPYLNITGVPTPPSPFGGGGTPGVASTFEIQAPEGENLRYVLGNSGSTANPNWYLAEWNSSKTIPMIGAGSNPSSTQINASTPNRYDWNVSFPIVFTAASSPTIRAVKYQDILFGSNGSWPTGTSGPNYAYPSEVTVWAVSVKPGEEGRLIYMKNLDIEDEATNQNIMFERATADEGVFVAIKVPSCTFIGYNMRTGDKIWETDAQSDWNAYGYFAWPSLISQTQTKMAYGMLFTGGYTGAVSAYSLKDGSLVWRQVYPSGGEKIQNFVQMLGCIADGKIYVGTHEHSADTPLYKGEKVHCLNVTNGAEIWSMAGWAYPMTFAVADGVLVYWNNYDAQVYAIGKGPTAMTVSAPDAASPVGTSITIKGTVMDVSAGTKQGERAYRFPNGVAAVSEESMSGWMEYVYQQKGRPTNVTGVPVSLIVLDSNGNYREIGATTSSANGQYSLSWKPDIPGHYTVFASFAGSKGYWPSSAETSFTVDEAAPTQAPAATPVASMTDTYFIPAVVGIIVAIVVVGAVIILLTRKRP